MSLHRQPKRKGGNGDSCTITPPERGPFSHVERRHVRAPRRFICCKCYVCQQGFARQRHDFSTRSTLGLGNLHCRVCLRHVTMAVRRPPAEMRRRNHRRRGSGYLRCARHRRSLERHAGGEAQLRRNAAHRRAASTSRGVRFGRATALRRRRSKPLRRAQMRSHSVGPSRRSIAACPATSPTRNAHRSVNGPLRS